MARHRSNLLLEVLRPMTLCGKKMQRSLLALHTQHIRDLHRVAWSAQLRQGCFLEEMRGAVLLSWMGLPGAISRGTDSCDWKGPWAGLGQNCHRRCDRKKTGLLEAQSLYLRAVQLGDFPCAVEGIALAHD